VDGSAVWYRGKRNLDAMLVFLEQGYGLADAEEVRKTSAMAAIRPTV
jgi:hypothetical protein